MEEGRGKDVPVMTLFPFAIVESPAKYAVGARLSSVLLGAAATVATSARVEMRVGVYIFPFFFLFY